MSPSTERLLRLLVETQAPAGDWRKAWRLVFAQIRQEVDLHPRGATPAAVFEAAAATTRSVSATCLPLGMGLVMHLYPLCALRCVPLPWWSAAHHRRHAVLRAIDRNGLILANAGSERVAGVQSPVTLTRSSGDLRVDGTFDYVSLANVADLVLFSAPIAAGASTGDSHLFCIASLRADTARVGPPRFDGTLKVADTCSLRFEKHPVPKGHCVEVPNDTALGCMTQYQRAWFQLLAAEAHGARLDALHRRWQLPRTSEAVASHHELSLLRDHALDLLNRASSAEAIARLARVTAAIKLRTSWHCQSMATALEEWDAPAAAELRLLKRQPTADDRILRGMGAAPSVGQPLVVDQRGLDARAGRGTGVDARAHSPEPAT